MPTTRTMSDGTTKTDYSLTETAQIVRRCLKEAFPGVKFSVRGTRGGSIRIGWADGPLLTAVEALVNRFQDASMWKRHEVDGKPVVFGADYIFCNRNVSKTVHAAVDQLSDAELTHLAFKLDILRGTDILKGTPVWRAELVSRCGYSIPVWKGTQQPCAYAESVAIVGKY